MRARHDAAQHGNALGGVRSAWQRRSGRFDRRRHLAGRCPPRKTRRWRVFIAFSFAGERSAKRKAEPLPHRRADSRKKARLAGLDAQATALRTKSSPPPFAARMRSTTPTRLRQAQATRSLRHTYALLASRLLICIANPYSLLRRDFLPAASVRSMASGS